MTVSDQVRSMGHGQSRAGTILCVEDEQDLREMLAEELEDAGYIVLQAGDGEDAWACLKHVRPDLILCDIAMPGVDGYALLSRIRESRSDLSEVPFVFLSAQDGSGQIIHGKHAGADDYLVKPINFDLMLATIAARIRQMRRVQDSTSGKENLKNSYNEQQEKLSSKVFEGMRNAFNMLSAGVVLLDSNGAVLFANIAVLRLEEEGVSPDLTHILRPNDSESFFHLFPRIHAAIKASRRGREYTDYLSLKRSDQQSGNLLLTICALADAAAKPEDPVVALFIAGSNQNEPAPIKRLESLFKLTPTEARIAWAFVQGMRPEEIATAFDVSPTTVAFHKRNIFRKTQTNREVDLIALLLTLSVVTEEAAV